MNDKPPLPGTFHNTAGPSIPEQPRVDPKPEASKELVKKYTMFRETFHPKEDVVYYPSCALDVSPSMAFPESRVIYVDISVEAIKKLRAAGYEAYRASATEELSDPPIAAYSPKEPVDILILLNPAINPEIPLQTIPNNGFVLCNNYHGTAAAVYEHQNFKLNGIIHDDPTNQHLEFDQEHLNEYFEEVETEEQWENNSVMGRADYTDAVTLVETITGKREDIISQYRRMIGLAKEQMQQHSPEQLAQLQNNPFPSYLLDFNGKQYSLPLLPPKKSTAGIFVFQRIHQDNLEA